ncbi:hypothetical protein EV702DRAFT_329988 [Suillus placidus]|uniref:Uncharacterized protein n=1 Tax=Suillus placidus TaxID=48579 RepID=A0A9P6ZTV3_9AGAM|nr:hypothetical protein EV702DRAFT_329988 [Suillus placidus]
MTCTYPLSMLTLWHRSSQAPALSQFPFTIITISQLQIFVRKTRPIFSARVVTTAVILRFSAIASSRVIYAKRRNVALRRMLTVPAHPIITTPATRGRRVRELLNVHYVHLNSSMPLQIRSDDSLRFTDLEN